MSARPVRRSRRGILRGGLALLAHPFVAAASLAAGPNAKQPGGAGCIERPRQTEGPFFVAERPGRGDIRSDPADGSLRPGVPLRLTVTVSRREAGRCVPAKGVIVDVWHCDAHGAYSEVDDGGRLAPHGHGFLRGYLLTDERGRAQFLTIYPGWYPGRTVHIHFKLRTAEGDEGFTSQLYFDDALTDTVHRMPPYAGRGPRDTRNPQDGIYRRGGEALMLAVAPEGAGYAASFELALPA